MNKAILNVTFKNEEKKINVKLPYLVAFGSSTYQNGIQREVLEYQFEDNDDYFNLLSDVYREGTDTIIQEYQNSTDEKDNPIIDISEHINYAIPIELSKRHTDEKSRIILKLAQLGKIEIMQKELAERLDKLEQNA